MVIEFSFGDFFCGLCDRCRWPGVEQTQVLVRLCRGPFNQTHSANEWPRKSVAAYRKVQNRTMRGRTVESIRGHGHLAHRILFDSVRFIGHAERSAPTLARRERPFFGVRPLPCADGIL